MRRRPALPANPGLLERAWWRAAAVFMVGGRALACTRRRRGVLGRSRNRRARVTAPESVGLLCGLGHCFRIEGAHKLRPVCRHRCNATNCYSKAQGEGPLQLKYSSQLNTVTRRRRWRRANRSRYQAAAPSRALGLTGSRVGGRLPVVGLDHPGHPDRQRSQPTEHPAPGPGPPPVPRQKLQVFHVGPDGNGS